MEIVFEGWTADFSDVRYTKDCTPVGSNCVDYSCRGNHDN